MPAGFTPPLLEQYYRAVDVVADTKEATEAQLYAALTDLTNLDLRLVCYDLTSTYFEGSPRPSHRFPSKAFGYSRDHRSDRPQVVVGLLCTSDGIPIAHHVFAGNTSDVSTLPGVLDDLQARFGVGPICVVADRGLISADNVDIVAGHGFDHVLATRLHRDPTCHEALEQSVQPDATWVPVPSARCAACDITLDDGRRAVVVASAERHDRDTVRTAELVARTETRLLALEDRVRDGRLVDAGQHRPGRPTHPRPLRRRAAVRRRDRRGPFPLPLQRRRASPTKNCSPAATSSSPHSPPNKPPPPKSSLPTDSCNRSSIASASSRTSCTCAQCGIGLPRGIRTVNCVFLMPPDSG